MTTGHDASPPPGNDLDGLLNQVRECTLAQRTAMDEALNRFAEAATPECPLAVDTRSLGSPGRRTEAQNGLYHRGWRLAYLMASNVGDHLQAIGDVAGTPPRLFAHMTLARAALEAAARINYLLDPSGTTPERVLRAAALLIASGEEELKAVAEFDTRPGLQAIATTAAKRRHDDILRIIERADIEVRRQRRDGRVSGVLWPGTSDGVTECRPNVTRLLKTLLPGQPAAYRVGSGAVHSQPWVLDDDDAFDLRSRRLKWNFDPAALAGSVSLAVSASVLTIDAFATMLGQDASLERNEAKGRDREVSIRVSPLLGG